ncbi:MAG: M61 family metallopeptidase [Oscillatoriales cyanobacterium SM2_1_8]|nr:M61 family metallopeptidase [Oscillatoriales cyanobacterium SM2_1_8]
MKKTFRAIAVTAADLAPWRYTVAFPQPETHLLHVRLEIPHWETPVLNLHWPTWTPGSYLIREYARHLRDFEVTDGDLTGLLWQKTAKNVWRISVPEPMDICVTYRIFANELSVRTNHLDRTHAYFNGAAVFGYAPGHEKRPFVVKIAMPQPDWQVATPLPCIAPNTYRAQHYDELVDSPFEVGHHQRHDFTAGGKPHVWVVWGTGNLDLSQVAADTAKIVETTAQMFGGLPYDRYWFFLALSANGYGGLEHDHACSLLYKRFGFQGESYRRFLNLVAHEFFHVWNVRRIRPKAFERYDYDREDYTHALWFAEGATSYYDQLIPLRAGLYDRAFFLQLLGESISRLQTTPGRRHHSLWDASLEAWIKLYRPDAESVNVQVSYYLKGELVCLLLDLAMRATGRSLDEVWPWLWQTYGQTGVGYTDAELLAGIGAIAGFDLSDFWEKYLYGTAELDYNRYLRPFGLQVVAAETDDRPPYTGLVLHGGKTTVRQVLADSPARQAGLDPEDELVALDGFRVESSTWEEHLKRCGVGATVALTYFRDQRLHQTTLTLAEPRQERYVVLPVLEPLAAQQELLSAWLGT